MAWTAHGDISIDLRQARDRMSRRAEYDQSLEAAVTGWISVAAEATVVLLGGAGGVYDTVFSPLRFIALMCNAQLEVLASNTTIANNPVVIEADGLYFLPLCDIDHLQITNPSTTDVATVMYYLGGDAA